MDLFYGIRSLAHHAKYTIGGKSILRSGIPQCDLSAKDRAYFERLANQEKQLLEDEKAALKALAAGQNAHAQRMANWTNYQLCNDAASAHRLSSKLHRQIGQAQHQSQILELKRSHKELLAANRMANDRMKWTTVNTTATASGQAQQQEQSQGQQQQWGGV
jgi:leucyl aminopeptidase (aminopeptidase T)